MAKKNNKNAGRQATKQKQKKPQTKTPSKRKQGRKFRGVRVSEEGEKFLKATIAPWDFPGTMPEGVPDAYPGKSVVRLHKQIFDIVIPDGAVKDTFIVLPPMPGIAYLLSQPATGASTTLYSAKRFYDYDAIFGTYGQQNAESMLNNFTRFRIIGQSARLQATSAVLNNSGRITVARLENVSVESPFVQGQRAPSIAGLYTATASEIGSYPGAISAHVNDGLTAWTTNGKANWEFSSIWSAADVATAAEDQTKIVVSFDAASPANKLMSGWGNTVPLAFAITGSIGGNTTISMEISQLVEYIPVPGSILAGSSRPSAPHDEAALEYYKYAAREMPIAVTRAKNDGYWTTFLDLVATLAQPVGSLFGPKGMLIGATLSTVATGLRSLTLGNK